MPALNEERYIAAAINSILPLAETVECELLVMDGGSTDATREIVDRLAADDPRIKLLPNPRRIQSAALNIAARACDPRSSVIVRADCHAHYPADFVARCVATLAATKSASVVVPMRAVGKTPLQKAIALAQNSRLGNGGSLHRIAGQSGYVDHGHHAAFERATFLALGGYDETAPFNEDAEYDARLAAAGHRIYLDGDLTIDYFPRATLRALSKQYGRHGWGRANTILKHGKPPKLRQVLPVVVLLACVASLLLVPILGPVALVPAVAYVGASILWGMLLAFRSREPIGFMSGVAAITMHMSWAIGFLARLAAARMPALVAAVRTLKERVRSLRTVAR